MPVHTDWFDKEAAIIIMTYTGTWSLAERHAAREKVSQLSHETSKRFDIIVNLTNASPFLPVGTFQVWISGIQQREVTLPHWGLSVFVTQSKTLEAYFNAGRETSSTIQDHAHLVKTVDEAVQVIMDDRQQAPKD